MFDEECRLHAGEQYKAAGVKLQLNVTPTKIEKQSDGKMTVTVEPKDGDKYTIADADVVLLATGRSPNTKDLGLEEVRAVPWQGAASFPCPHALLTPMSELMK